MRIPLIECPRSVPLCACMHQGQISRSQYFVGLSRRLRIEEQSFGEMRRTLTWTWPATTQRKAVNGSTPAVLLGLAQPACGKNLPAAFRKKSANLKTVPTACPCSASLERMKMRCIDKGMYTCAKITLERSLAASLPFFFAIPSSAVSVAMDSHSCNVKSDLGN